MRSRNLKNWTEWDVCAVDDSAISRWCSLVLRDDDALVVVRGRWACDVCDALARLGRMTASIGRLSSETPLGANTARAASTLNELAVLDEEESLLRAVLDEEYARVQRDFPEVMKPLGGAS